MASTLKQLRLASCVKTIVEIHSSLDQDRVDPILVRKFKDLEESLRSVELKGVSERDVLRVEEATNRLLQELGLLFEYSRRQPIHQGLLH